ncbi:MAG: M56 family metallopeptidase [Planctomycetaceae bacterium]|nr:M56 family metallopeptidase [Planctomycetaceae bacterium]
MNFNTELVSDSTACLSLALLHSLWLVAMPAGFAWIWDRRFGNRSPQSAYVIHLAALCISLSVVPVTYRWISAAHQQPANTPVAVFGASRSVASSGLPHKTAAADIALESPTGDVGRTGTHAWSFLQRCSPFVVGFYFCGVILMLSRLIQDVFRLHNTRQTAHLVTDSGITETLEMVCRQLRVRVVPALLTVERVVVPHVTGLLRPAVVLPISAVSGLTAEELELLLAHEVAHIRRRDLWVLPLQRMAETLLFFNPAVWLISRRLNVLREYCCDDYVCRTPTMNTVNTGKRRLRYAGALLKVAEHSTAALTRRTELAAIAAVPQSPSELRRRIARLLGEPLTTLSPVSCSSLVLFVTLIALPTLTLLPMSVSRAAQSPEEKQQQTSAAAAAADTGTPVKAKPVVRIVAVGTHDSTPQQWWDATGGILEDVPFTWTHQQNMSAESKLWRRLVVAVDNVPEDATVTWKLIGPTAVSGGTPSSTEPLPAGTRLMAKWFAMPDDNKTVSARIGIGTADWQTVAKSDARSATATGYNAVSVVFSKAFSDGMGTGVIVSHNVFDQEFRIRAVDDSGTIHESPSRGGVSAGQVYQSQAAFPRLPGEKIREVQFQMRPYTWMEVRAENIPLQPKREHRR